MRRDEYLEELERLKRNGERAIIKKLPNLEKQAFDLLRRWVDENLDTSKGFILPNDSALKGLNTFSDTYTALVTELADYRGSVGQFLKNFKDIRTLMTEFQTSQGVDVKQARLGAVQEIVVNEIVNRYSENGLNAGFVQPMRELLYNNIVGGLSKTDALDQLKDYIASGKDTTGKLGRYLEQTAQQGVDSYTGATNTRIMQTFEINTMFMSGSLIATSSPQCRFAINRLNAIIDRKDWPDLKKLAEKHGLIEGTTFDNLPFNKLHWGCRHEFTPTVLTAPQRRTISSPGTNI